MRDRMERFVLLPFTAGCISESSIAVGLHQQAKRSRIDMNSITPTRIRERDKDECDELSEEDDDESLSGENPKSPSSISSVPRFQKLFKNFKNLSQLFAYKDELEETEEEDAGMEIGLPTDVKHVTHIGLDGCSNSILSKGWNNTLIESPGMIDQAPFPLMPLELAMAARAENPTVRSLLETK
ncbi:CRIB domain-containing protein RIC4 [Andrographis paniculata]|uniref:CRIB domain-containing protein RIC4 n=1 Tax=Andrographis paniculata TaxID=175694 RepID=UPI0021E77509|nr:CRIB domain-containing protein RIC4 [Andrographis paniculata]